MAKKKNTVKENLIKKITGTQFDNFYFVLRIIVGFMFFQHGAKKILGWYGANNIAPLFSQIGLAGSIEIVVGVLLIFGLFTRLGAIVGAIEMIVAYIMVHAPQGLTPLVNRGELAVLYFVIFLIIAVLGSGKWSLENKLLKKEIF